MTTFFYVYPFAEAGDVSPIPLSPPVSPPGGVNYQNGYTINYEDVLGTDPNALPIERTLFNQLVFDITNNLQQYQTQGTPNFITSSQNLGVPYPYPIYAHVFYSSQIWENQVAGNTATPGADNTWVACNVNSIVPSGTVIDFAGATPPTGYLLCDGSAISRTDYANLFSAIGVLWGAGDGSTTFNIPALSRRVTMGSGGSGSAIISNTTGSIGGTEGTSITVGQLPVGCGKAASGWQTTSGWQSGSNSGSRSIETGVGSWINGSGDTYSIIQPSAIMTKCIKT